MCSVPFSGNCGDILWSLPTVRALSWLYSPKVDFCCMGMFDSLIPLIQRQPYVDKAFSWPTWTAVNDMFGRQPWYPPREVEQGYERVFHLGYRFHPNIPLIDFTAEQQGLKLKAPLPFLEVDSLTVDGDMVAVAFNDYEKLLTNRFLGHLRTIVPEGKFVEVTGMPWLEAAAFIKAAKGFVGCRSANNVMAHGVKQDNIFIYETHPDRHSEGRLGVVFGCPYHGEETANFGKGPEDAAEQAATNVRKWLNEEKKTSDIQIEKEELCEF